MPTYDYQCPACGGFEARRGVDARDEPMACPDCGAASARVMSAAPRLVVTASPGAAGTLQRAGNYARLGHGSACGCCTKGGNKASLPKRPRTR